MDMEFVKVRVRTFQKKLLQKPWSVSIKTTLTRDVSLGAAGIP